MSAASQAITHVVFHGRVQAVGFRAFVERAAREHGLAGWVRNRRDGTVEAVLAGQAQAVRSVIEACRRGPPAARVDSIAERAGGAGDLALRHQSEAFSVLPTL
jgi:acylphosphatase